IAYAAHKSFTVYQMDVKTAFLYGPLNVGTPMATKHLDVDLSGTPIDQMKYRSMVGALMYSTASRPDIMHAICYCAHYPAKPTEKHLTAVKWIFRYLKDTIHMGLWYPKDIGFELTAFLDSDHAGCLDSFKSTSGGIQFLGGDKLVSWSSKKQDCTSMSSVKTDYSHLVQSSPAFTYQAHRRRYHFIKEKVEKEGILHQTSVARTPEQNSIVKRQNRTIVEAARTMLSAAKVPLFFWAEAIATTCFTQNRSLVIPRHEKTPFHIINERKPSVKFFHIFGSLCYFVRDGENLDKMKEKDHVSSDPVKECPTTALEHDSLSPGLQCQENVPQADRIITTSNELDLLFSPMIDELLNGSSQVVSKSSAVTTTDALNQQMIAENAQVADEEFINIFCTPVQNRGETSSRHVDSSNMHTFYQHHPSEHRWTKDHPLEHVIGNPSQSVRTRCQLESDGEMCMFALTASRTEPKNIKEAMADSAWIELMQDELHQFDRLDVWELVDRPLCKNVINMKWLWKKQT
nr:integrase, catalytic region, zinc finger, CCHC-type, peptidase aspartic, catalytic [Tanacetum cinerariifolium]